MIFGVGVDITQISRIDSALKKSNGRLVKKILGIQEQEQYYRYAANHPMRSLAYLATRFSAKEACAKALGIGMRMPMAWHAVQVLNLKNGKPYLQYSSVLQAWLEQHSLALAISLSDEREYAVAYVTAWYACVTNKTLEQTI